MYFFCRTFCCIVSTELVKGTPALRFSSFSFTRPVPCVFICKLPPVDQITQHCVLFLGDAGVIGMLTSFTQIYHHSSRYPGFCVLTCSTCSSPLGSWVFFFCLLHISHSTQSSTEQTKHRNIISIFHYEVNICIQLQRSHF